MPVCCVCHLGIDHFKFPDPNGYLIVPSKDIVTMKPRIVYAHHSCALRTSKIFDRK